MELLFITYYIDNNFISSIFASQSFSMNPVYLDNAATTPIREEVIEVMTEVLKHHYGNASSSHSFGRASKALIEKARKTIAGYLNVSAGEILFTSMDHDGTKNGFANEALAYLSELVNIPIIASGGAGNMQHFCDTFKNGKADAALAASVFHYKEIEIKALKSTLRNQGINVRL